MKIRCITIVALAVLPFAAIQPAQAAGEVEPLAPPFTSADHWSDCYAHVDTPAVDLPGGSCTHDADATKEGVLGINLHVESDGPLPARGHGNGSASVGVFDWLDGPSVVLYSVTYTVSDARAEARAFRVPMPVYASGSSAYIEFYGTVSAFGGDAYASFGHPLACRFCENTNGTFTRRLILSNQDGSPLHGPVSLDFGLWGSTSMEPTTDGVVDAGAAVQITSVTSQVIA